MILSELDTLKRIGDIALVAEICVSGVRLFYAIMTEYTVLKTCPPIEQFVLNILQSIGNVLISHSLIYSKCLIEVYEY